MDLLVGKQSACVTLHHWADVSINTSTRRAFFFSQNKDTATLSHTVCKDLFSEDKVPQADFEKLKFLLII